MLFALLIAAAENGGQDDLLNHVPFLVAVAGIVGAFIKFIKWMELRHDRREAALEAAIAAERQKHVEYLEDEPKRATRIIARYLREVKSPDRGVQE
jgi:hypothetical protein